MSEVVLDEMKNIQNEIDKKIASMRDSLDEIEYNVNGLVGMIIGLSMSLNKE